MFFLYLILWIIFNGKVTLEIVIIGSIISFALTMFMCKYGDYSIVKEKHIIRKIKVLIKYAYVLMKEITKANLSVIHLILSTTEEPEPAIIEFETDLKTDGARTLLANAITLTPGTISVHLEKNKYVVHALDDTFLEGIADSKFVELLREFEAEPKKPGDDVEFVEDDM